MVIGFKKQFVHPIIEGTKIHTVREDATRRWKPGIMMHMATGVRTKNYECFKQVPCVSTQKVFMTFRHIIEISVGGNELFGFQERERFAINDGFESLDQFEAWFYPLIKANPKQQFVGRVIHWTSLQY